MLPLRIVVGWVLSSERLDQQIVDEIWRRRRRQTTADTADVITTGNSYWFFYWRHPPTHRRRPLHVPHRQLKVIKWFVHRVPKKWSEIVFVRTSAFNKVVRWHKLCEVKMSWLNLKRFYRLGHLCAKKYKS